MVATHQKTQQGLKREIPINQTGLTECRNASENPAGIETGMLVRFVLLCFGRNASENPAGIETPLDSSSESAYSGSQRIRKPSRD